MSIAQPSSMVAWLNIISASQATAIQTQPSVHALSAARSLGQELPFALRQLAGRSAQFICSNSTPTTCCSAIHRQNLQMSRTDYTLWCCS